MSNGNNILNYVMNTPSNTNRAILKSLLEEYKDKLSVHYSVLYIPKTQHSYDAGAYAGITLKYPNILYVESSDKESEQASFSIRSNAFSGNLSLKYAILGNLVNGFGGGFEGCTNVETFAVDKFTKSTSHTLYSSTGLHGLTNLKTLFLPQTIFVEAGVFGDMPSLSECFIGGFNSTTAVNAFGTCLNGSSNLKTLVINKNTNYTNPIDIQPPFASYWNKRSLLNLTIGNFDNIKGGAFQNNELSIMNLYLFNVSSIQPGAFSGININSVYLYNCPDIQHHAFDKCRIEKINYYNSDISNINQWNLKIEPTSVEEIEAQTINISSIFDENFEMISNRVKSLTPDIFSN